MISDDRCLQHVGFDNYANTKKRSEWKNDIPENAERLMVLIDKEKGTLTSAEGLIQYPGYKVQKGTKPVELGDVYRVHDHNYLRKVIELTNKLRLIGDTAAIARYGKLYILILIDRDTALSAKSWDISLLSCGAVIDAVDKVMNGETSNAFCAVRPPGHHAGVFG